MDPFVLANAVLASGVYRDPETLQAIRKQLERMRQKVAADAVDQALENVSEPAKAELDQLSEATREDLRLQLLESLDQGEREMWASVLAMQSSEKTSSKLVVATWGLVTATIGLVVVTVVLVLVTVAKH